MLGFFRNQFLNFCLVIIEHLLRQSDITSITTSIATTTIRASDDWHEKAEPAIDVR